VGGKLYTFGGFNWSTPCCTPWRYAFVYDPTSNAWTRLADMPEGLTHAGATTDGTDVYYAGGFPEDASRTFQIFGTKHVWRYRVASNDYEALPDLPDDRGAGALRYLDGKLHFFGGRASGRATTPPSTGCWTSRVAAPPGSRRHRCCPVAPGTTSGPPCSRGRSTRSAGSTGTTRA
jgi:hypothetical protein